MSINDEKILLADATESTLGALLQKHQDNINWLKSTIGDEGGGDEPSALSRYTTFGQLSYGDVLSKIPNFRNHWIAKDKNLVVVNTGTSLTSRTTEHCTAHPDAKTRPPLMHSHNFASHIWDALKWEGQQYRRYDSGFFTETGTWQTSHNLAEWDDGSSRNGLTRYSDEAGSTLKFTIPSDAWQCNLIGRLDSAGTENATLTVAEGNGKLQVWRGGSSGKNLFNDGSLTSLRPDRRLSTLNGGFTPNTGQPICSTVGIAVEAGDYCVSGAYYRYASGARASLFTDAATSTTPIAGGVTSTAITDGAKFTVSQAGYLVFDVEMTDTTWTAMKGWVQLERGSVVTAYEPYSSGPGWTEANGFTFSMKQPTQTTVSFSHTNPATGTTDAYADYPVSGNTTYQARVLKMKAVDRTVSKNVTISRTGGRLLYWGVEWSPREFMITYINAARGSHGISIGNSSALQRYQDNEIWSFKPDLMLTENPIHNSGGGSVPSGSYPSSYWGDIANQFFLDENVAVSLVERAAANDIENLEWVIFNSSLAVNFGAIDDDGNLKIGIDKNGRALTALDAQMMSSFLLRAHPNTIVIDAVKNWCDAAVACYGDLKTATTGSGKTGNTFTNEGSHWNDTGAKVMARVVLPVLDFVR